LAFGDQVLFHCDPHAGNLLYTTDNRVAILDWSLVASPRARDVEMIAQCFVTALTFDAQRLAETIGALAERGRPDTRGLHAAATHGLARLRGGALPGLSWFVDLLDDATQNAGLRVSPELLLIRKALLSLEGVLGELGLSRQQLDTLLLSDFMIQLAAEWPRRWMSPPWSREFATRLSNADLWQLAAGWPATAARWATGAFG
jgi:predicted unusual protein kinase regulating ubiquinone biosynthesis (AarF/ABC1/UbiB family)